MGQVGLHYIVLLKSLKSKDFDHTIKGTATRILARAVCVMSHQQERSLMRQDATANRLARAIGDMQEAQHYLMVLWKLKSGRLEINEDIIVKSVEEAVIVAAIIAYSRPFKNSNSGGKADRRISLSDLDLVSGDPELISLHNTIIDKRDRAVAHADWEYHPTELVGIEGGMTVRHSPRPDYIEGISLEAFQRLSELVCKQCMELTYNKDVENAQAKDSYPSNQARSLRSPDLVSLGRLLRALSGRVVWGYRKDII